MRIHVRLFKNRFEGKLNVTKFGTIRPPCKHPGDEPKPGDILDCRVWTGRPYRSAQRLVCYGVVTENVRISVHEDGVFLYDNANTLPVKIIATQDNLDAFAVADGFEDWKDMREWFEADRGLPVMRQRFIKWKPLEGKGPRE